MADRGDNAHAVPGLALILLGAALHYGWALAPAEHQAQAWNILGAVTRSALLLACVWRVRSLWVLSVAAWWLAEEVMVAGCSALFIAAPWPIGPGQAQCSALLMFDLGKVGAVLLCVLAITCKHLQCRR